MADLTIKQKQRRLLILADFLEKKVPAMKFDMSSFVDFGEYSADWESHEDSASAVKDLSCDTTACAAGWAATQYPQWGLGYPCCVNSYDLMEVFGIDSVVKDELFFGPACTPKQWAKLARKVYKELQEETE